MRVLAACSLGGAGHLGPLVPFLDAAVRRGDDVLVAGPAALSDMVGRAGFPFVAGGQPGEAEVAAIREQLPVVPREEATVLGNRELFGRLATRAMLPVMEHVCATWGPDLVMRDPCEYASAVVAHRKGITAAQVAISLADAEWGSISVAAPALEEHRPGLTAEVRRAPYVTRFPASLDPSPFANTVRVRDVPPPTQPPLPDWWGGSDGPLVYVTFGTVLGYMSIAGQVYRAAIAAVEGVAARVLLTVGRQFDPVSLGSVPSHVHVEAWADQAQVLSHADLVVCHGGSGTAFGALGAALPLVMVPVFADQFENSRRIAAAGAGLIVRGDGVVGLDDAPRIAEAILAVLGDTSFRRIAEGLSAEMATSGTADQVLDALLDERV
jgi:UDP:flavonoid glycosyltransferase YjiC (YdhE family)